MNVQSGSPGLPSAFSFMFGTEVLDACFSVRKDKHGSLTRLFFFPFFFLNQRLRGMDSSSIDCFFSFTSMKYSSFLLYPDPHPFTNPLFLSFCVCLCNSIISASRFQSVSEQTRPGSYNPLTFTAFAIHLVAFFFSQLVFCVRAFGSMRCTSVLVCVYAMGKEHEIE